MTGSGANLGTIHHPADLEMLVNACKAMYRAELSRKSGTIPDNLTDEEVCDCYWDEAEAALDVFHAWVIL